MTAMHVYGHQWACQLAYNPHLCHGLGLTDGKGVERTWLRLRKLIGVVRPSSVSSWLCPWMLSLINWLMHREPDKSGSQIVSYHPSPLIWEMIWVIGLGIEWKEVLRNRDKWPNKSSRQSLPLMQSFGGNWNLQKAAQMSVQSRMSHLILINAIITHNTQLLAAAPAHHKKELDTVLTLQGDLDSVEKAIHMAKLTLSQFSTPLKLTKILKGLEEMHNELSDKVEELYVSLNIPESYPDLEGVGLEFIWMLLMTPNLKVNIWKRAIGSFFEWDWLDQVVGRRSNPLGMFFPNFSIFLFVLKLF